MRYTREKNGITLVALVITIVILLILVGITISTLGGENGLLTRAKQVKQAQIESEMKEQLTLALQDLQIEKLGNATLDDVTQEWIDGKIQNYNCTVKEDASISGKRIIMEKNGVICKFLIDENLNVTEIEESESGAQLEYETISRDGENISILITITDAENGLQQVEFPDGTILYCNGEQEIAKDYEVQLGVEYIVKITSKDGQVKEETILINDYYHTITKNLGEGIIIDNPAIKAAYNKPYQATITTENGNMISVLTVTMGGETVDVNKTTGTINIEKVTGDIEITAMARNVIVVSGDTNEETGEVTLDLEKYVDQAESGDIIYIPEGIYNLIPITSTIAYTNDLHLGIHDKGKKLTFVGENEKTILKYYPDANDYKPPLIQFANKDSSIRNLVLDYYPSSTNGNNNAIFTHSVGSVNNVFFRIYNTNYKARYIWTNYDYQDMNVNNCTFYFADITKVLSDYGGPDTSYFNILANYAPNGRSDSINIITKNISDDILSTKTDTDAIANQVGVYYGVYAWN